MAVHLSVEQPSRQNSTLQAYEIKTHFRTPKIRDGQQLKIQDEKFIENQVLGIASNWFYKSLFKNCCFQFKIHWYY